ncbi:MAG TPA: DNA topoisomerase IB [Stellaceae bacterium]|jgi:DNA topoisomerase-1|nr:DNA topoisomerase IB [Stellaceae bacterium]
MLQDEAQNGSGGEAGLLDPVAAATEAGLRYVTDRARGYYRMRHRSGFVYKDSDGEFLTDEKVLARIRSLAIPPAYRDVWICRDANGHLQAVGRDARGRKQYRYHPRWRVVRDEAKYGKMLVFARVLPRVRRRVDADLARRGLPREKVLAAIVRLLEQTLARIGNEEYAKANNSFGLTTLRNRHVKVKGGQIIFDFRAKHGISSHIDLEDRRLARIIRRCQELPGQELFQYLDEDDALHAIGSEDVNNYLRDISGEEITAKDFRTWSATNLAAVAFRHLSSGASPTPTKSNILAAVTAVAKMLGNTPAICRKCYIHPAIIDGYLDGTLLTALNDCRARSPKYGLSAQQKAVVLFLGQKD